MKFPVRMLASVIAASSIALALPLAAQAAPMGGDRHCSAQQSMEGRHGQGHGQRGGMRHMVRGLDLSEQQRDQIFALMHEQRPVMRAKMKEVRNTRQALRALSLSDAFDEAAARQLATQGAQAAAEMAELRARTEARIFQLLTPEQREQVRQKQASGESRFGMGRMGRHGFDGDRERI